MIRFGENCWFMGGLRVFWCGFGVGEGVFHGDGVWIFAVKWRNYRKVYRKIFSDFLCGFDIFYFGNGEMR